MVGDVSFPPVGIETGPQNAVPKVRILIGLGKGEGLVHKKRESRDYLYPRVHSSVTHSSQMAEGTRIPVVH